MMRAALALARRSLGRTWPNPAVGCVIVKDGLVVGRGRTQDGGRPHAEVDALNQAGGAARGRAELTAGSRSAVQVGNASAKAGAAMRKLILERAGEVLEADPVDLVMDDGERSVASR